MAAAGGHWKSGGFAMKKQADSTPAVTDEMRKRREAFEQTLPAATRGMSQAETVRRVKTQLAKYFPQGVPPASR